MRCNVEETKVLRYVTYAVDAEIQYEMLGRYRMSLERGPVLRDATTIGLRASPGAAAPPQRAASGYSLQDS